jgi:hypothetical protein
MFAPIARAGVKDEPRIDFDNIIINGSVRYFGLVKQRQGGEALGRVHLVTADPGRSSRNSHSMNESTAAR